MAPSDGDDSSMKRGSLAVAGNLYSMSVRVRFAPSPTGKLHVGALRMALFDHLFAKKHGGQNILRIEDTDRGRYNAESEKEFIDTLHWAGIDFDEGPHVGGPNGPYRQSERQALGIYDKYAKQLIAEGHAYLAFDTPEELEAIRNEQLANKGATGYYGGIWRDATPAMIEQAISEGRKAVVRQKVPRDRKIEVEDAIRGKVEFDLSLMPDQVLVKTDGMPTYHLAAIVDDHLMGITHVLRGDEWLSTFPLHWLLSEQFGWDRPVYVHCSVITGKDGKKLSKRLGATSVLDYAARGYLKEALKNFVALIGWAPGDEREVMSEAELVEAFSLEGLQAHPGRFDIDKLRWLNGHVIRQTELSALLDELVEYVRDPNTQQYWETYEDQEQIVGRAPIDGKEVLKRLLRISEAVDRDRNYVLAALKEEQERVQTLADFGESLEFFLLEVPVMDEKAVAKWLAQPHASALFDWILQHLEEADPETPEHYEQILKGFQTHAGLEKLGPIVHPTRVALTGKTFGPGLFELMAVLGHDRIVRRLIRAKRMAQAFKRMD